MISKVYVGNKSVSKIMLGNKIINFVEAFNRILNLQDVELTLTGNWLDSSLLGYDGSSTKYSTSVGDKAEWNFYVPDNSNYEVYAWFPRGTTDNASEVKYSISSLNGYWEKVINQNENYSNWVKLATVTGTGGTALKVTVQVSVSVNTRINAIRVVQTTATADDTTDINGSQDTTTIATFINQSGYDLDKTKRATITNVPDDTPFTIKKASDNSVVYNGTVTGQIVNFSDFNPSAVEEYYIECSGITSYNFKIAKYLLQRVSINPALRFMDGSRQDTWDVGGNTGYGWRDSHQFSFELNSLVLQYMANPSAYDRMTYGISHLSGTQYTELRTQNEPDIIWLVKFGAMRYYDLKTNQSKNLHAFIKGQLAYFLYLYPDISDYVSQSFYEMIRTLTVSEWSNPNCNLQWYEVSDGTDNNLFEVQSVIGDIKGQKPPGYAIVPNLLMYEVAKRDGLANYQDFFTAAYNNCEWLINNVDLDNPIYTKGQRMNEHITMEGLTYFYEMYPEDAPAGLYNKIKQWAQTMVNRSNNLWDMRKYADINDNTAYASMNQWTGGGNAYNEVGNPAGFMAVAYAVCRVLYSEDSVLKTRLQEIGIAQMDSVFGRNPFGRHFSYDAPTEIEGVDAGWFTFLNGGYGDLMSVAGVLDGSPKESAYPFNPVADPGYTEGWVAFNTCWNDSLAYSASNDVEVKIFDSTFINEISSASAGNTIGIRLKAPLNFNENVAETGEVDITLSNGTKSKLTVTEASNNDYYFTATYVVPADVTYVDVSYGYGLFKKSVRVNIV
ncbi:cellulase N-terminal Ig-like domain-containing protein [Clostridium pasteurianum]|uniref:N-terminal ig-like domain of cellulase n=1 Tax=Clostridium pasteurianum BC1 TaxID=86416 RepID=R4K4D9_CLOPA|nr:cellulase N-terminal Ig-like domain-containing protein [Clostridium pasteurianum]AGK95414.1 N-terminal ig-like domain of cellulase [Clostridium pasteurianum BC1]